MAKETKNTKKEVKAWMYDILKKPVITEKSTFVSGSGQIVFQVAPSATKKDIKEAVEAIYKTEVKDVNIVNIAGKSKRFRSVMGKRADIKKAYVTLADGQNVDFTSI
ncbi:MAG: 50S ribosomal protein L23 [Rickettsiales bacterium]|jgi:large subunit ribosomal protein L23|nr:50S ribosomal protein L23 [Rickettsiales bacterium]